MDNIAHTIILEPQSSYAREGGVIAVVRLHVQVYHFHFNSHSNRIENRINKYGLRFRSYGRVPKGKRTSPAHFRA